LAPTDTAGRAVAWAVVGLGGYARERMLPALRRARGTRLAGVYTRSELVRTRVAAEYGVRGYGSLQAILEDPAVDLVYLATPHDLHAAQTVACAVAGKHVLVEKPMAVSEAEAGAMVDACTRAGVTLRVGFQFRYHPAHRHARALLASSEIGDLVWAAARWSAYRPADTGWRLDLGRAGGTLLAARGVHLIDLIRFVTDTECVAVSGMSDGLRPESPADDVTVGLLALTSGAFAHVLCTRLVAGAEDGIELYGTQGTIVCRSTFGAEPGGTLVTRSAVAERRLSYDPCDLLVAQVESANDAVRGVPGPHPAATGVDGARVVAVTTALVASVQTGRTVTLDRAGRG
jgi:1,5-anhydro-D-fructose reductase (1,5-anhydro-D-mannitol-forming)